MADSPLPPRTVSMNGLEVRAAELAARDIGPWMQNPPELHTSHAEQNRGLVRTRFPPEPNGYLHIGHAKSMLMNFELAFAKLGVPPEARRTVFRYDDTNPEAESHEYVESLRQDLAWMGWTPEKVTYTSQYFGELYEMAQRLIRNGKAYVCHQTREEIQEDRLRAFARAQLRAKVAAGKATEEDLAALPAVACPHRDRPAEESLRLFEGMRRGMFDESEAVLRLRMDWESDNPNLWDQVAYRVRFTPHPNTGDTWCVYPTYDYTHCIIDSLEHVDYSICTLEFENRRESYYWVLWALDLFRPNVYEMSRLNVEYTQLSKRKLLKLVSSGFLAGWDDPRMPSIRGLRRRGYTPGALNAFCRDVGAGRNENMIEYERLSLFARADLDPVSPRCMCVFEPCRLRFRNAELATGERDVANFPGQPERGSHVLALSPEIWVDASDVRLEDPGPNVFCLAPGKVSAMKNIRQAVAVENVERDGNGRPTLVTATLVPLEVGEKRPKGNLSWAPLNAAPVEIRVYDHLFTKPVLEPDDDWEAFLNPASKIVYPDALIDPFALEGGFAPGRHVQIERRGFFVVDDDATADKLVLNRTVSLRQDAEVTEVLGSGASKSRKAEQEEQARLKELKRSIPPAVMFQEPHVAVFTEDRFTQWDAEGMPTHDSHGDPLPKSKFKKLVKEMKKQAKIYGT